MAAGLVAAPAAILQGLCAGHSCDNPSDDVGTVVPFCSLPLDVRAGVVNGFRDGRSPDILAVTAGGTAVRGISGLGLRAAGSAAWPSEAGSPDAVPLVLAGTGVARTGIPAGTTLDSVAPTLAEIAGLRRPHPEVRSGRAIGGVARGVRPRLILEVVWKGVGSRSLGDETVTPFLRELMSRGAGTLEARTGSLPLDPAATLTTLGTGGLPRQHGITGTLLRNEEGKLAAAWGPGAPLSVIASLGDDLDRSLGERPRIGLVATDASDRGAIGGNWYVDGDRDDVVLAPRATPAAAAAAAADMLGGGYGSDDVVDLAVVVMEGRPRNLDRALAGVVAAAEDASSGHLTTVVTATGDAATPLALRAADVRAMLEEAIDAPEPVIDAAVPGGLFLDQQAVARQGVTDDQVVTALGDFRARRRPVFGDAFSAVAVSFSRYC
jgi:hypothetical protein